MANLWMENVDADTSEAEIKEFLNRYGFPPFDAIQYVPGTGQHPAVVLSFNHVEEEALRLLQPRIHNIFWRDRTIAVQVIPPERED